VQGGATIHVPSLWAIEVANALLAAVRRKLMTDSQRRAAINLLFRTGAKVDSDTADLAWTAISDLAIKYGLSVYDASYLELAVRKTLPLASRDEPLRAAARKCGVKLM
jgi:predicted nucleic acid-binding protein